MNDGGHAVVGGRRRGSHYIRDQVDGLRLTGLGEVNLVAVPDGVALLAAACLNVIGGDQARRARRPVFWVPASHLAFGQVEVLDPDLPQCLHLEAHADHHCLPRSQP